MKDTTTAFSYFAKAVDAFGLDWGGQNISGFDFNPNLFWILDNLCQLRPFVVADTIPDQKALVSLMLSLNDHFGNIIQEGKAKIDYQQKIFSTYETALEASMHWENFASTEAFSFAERSKTTLLRSEVRNDFKAAYRGLPDSLQQKDRNLKKAIVRLEKKRFKLKQKEVPDTDSLMREIQNQLFTYKRDQEKLHEFLKANHPDYYQLQYQPYTSSVEAIQELLEPDQALIEYVVGNRSLFIFTITPNDYAVKQVKNDIPLGKWVRQIREGVYRPEIDLNLTSTQKDSLRNQYVEAALALHEKLIAPIQLKLPPRLIIIPDGVLGYLPFDVLLASPPEALGQYKTYEFLFKKHAISYNYSANVSSG